MGQRWSGCPSWAVIAFHESMFVNFRVLANCIILRSCLVNKYSFTNNKEMNNAQTAAKLIEYADRCIAAYDAADPSDRSVAMKRALAECFTDFSSMKPNLQLGSREKVIFSLDNNPKRHSVLKHVRNARSDIPVDKFIMKFAMPEIISERRKKTIHAPRQCYNKASLL